MNDTESRTQIGIRLVLERQCRELAELLKRKVTAGVGFVLFLSDFGAEGNLAYVSTVERKSCHKLIQEWLDHEDANHPQEGWQAAAEFLIEVAKAVGFDGEPEPWAVLERCRELKARSNHEP